MSADDGKKITEASSLLREPVCGG